MIVESWANMVTPQHDQDQEQCDRHDRAKPKQGSYGPSNISGRT
jgi:hypothetical protein